MPSVRAVACVGSLPRALAAFEKRGRTMTNKTSTRRSFVATAGALALGAAATHVARAFADEDVELAEDPAEPAEDLEPAEDEEWFPPEDEEVWLSPEEAANLDVVWEDGDYLEDPLEYFPPIELEEDSPYLDLDEDEAAIVGADVMFNYVPDVDGLNAVLEDIVFNALKSLGKTAWNTAMNYGKSQFMDIVFGSDDSSAQIISKLDEIQNKLDSMDATLRAVYELLETDKFKGQIDDFMNKYAGPTNRYTELIGGELDQMDKDYVGNESGLLAARLRFAENVLFPASGKDNYKVGGKQTLLAFVDEMAGALLDTQQRTGTNVVGAFDELCIREYRWEHQAYDARQQFRDYACSRFVMMASYLLVCLRDYLESHADQRASGGPGEEDYRQAYVALGDLFGTNAQAAVDAATGGNLIAENGAMTPDGKYGTILQMFEDGQVVRREGVRRFQVPGCEFELNPTACTVRSCEKGGTQQRQFIQDATGKPVMSADVVARLVRGYGGDISLKYALFDSEEGNVASPSGMDSIDIFALDEPIRKKKIKRSDGYNTVVYGYYYLKVAKDSGAGAEAEFAESTTQGNKTKWIWREVDAIAVYMA